MFSLLKKAQAPSTPSSAATDAPRRVVRPRTDIHEEAEAVVVTIDVPGCDGKDVSITAEEGVLTVRATPGLSAPEGYEAVWRERDERLFERSFTLPDSIDSGAASATVKHGVLTLRLPKAQQAKPRRIAVSAA